MGQLRQQREERLKLERYSYRTRKTCIQHIKLLVAYHEKDPRRLSARDIERYLLYLLDEKSVSHPYTNQAINAIECFYGKVLKQPLKISGLPWPKKVKNLPVVLSEEEVLKILAQIPNLKYQAITILNLFGWLTG